MMQHHPTVAGAVNHIGLTVPDIFAAIDWYTKVLGCRHIMGPRVLAPAQRATHETGNILGPRFRKAYQAHVVAANGVGIELFQFIDPPVEKPEDNMQYWRCGYWHLCFTAPEIEDTLACILANGGKQRCEIFEFVPGRPYKLVYCEDPFGNVIELFSHDYSQVFSDWPQPGMTSAPVFVNRADVRPPTDGAPS